MTTDLRFMSYQWLMCAPEGMYLVLNPLLLCIVTQQPFCGHNESRREGELCISLALLISVAQAGADSFLQSDVAFTRFVAASATLTPAAKMSCDGIVNETHKSTTCGAYPIP